MKAKFRALIFTFEHKIIGDSFSSVSLSLPQSFQGFISAFPELYGVSIIAVGRNPHSIFALSISFDLGTVTVCRTGLAILIENFYHGLNHGEVSSFAGIHDSNQGACFVFRVHSILKNFPI